MKTLLYAVIMYVITKIILGYRMSTSLLQFQKLIDSKINILNRKYKKLEVDNSNSFLESEVFKETSDRRQDNVVNLSRFMTHRISSNKNLVTNKRTAVSSFLNDVEKDFMTVAALEISDEKEYMSKQMKKKIAIRIKDFENNKLFLDRDMCLNALSAKMKVNHRYLSYYIKKYKEKDFSSYIGELRIGYIVECLEHNPDYLKFKINYLAEQSGFASHSRFTITFKKVMGISPSMFIDQIKKRRAIIGEI
ncbi:AraC family transcriptional regulator [Myroides sp. M-43]|uniref:helix-turn-helix domain-containing protein n=1 Tax=Myroides oncorhynchi TaxID=2893756 RepID=UPI001E565202|nr:AraC family transcriptional regulator [Myroides oncorhynchi]MCC9043102.1 AraC family transcriptional regulator [Myroides oncorhynchi]